MTIQEQVCTKSQAIRLKELGVRGESLFYWSDNELASKKELIDEFAKVLLDMAVDENGGNITYDKDKLQESAQKAFEAGYSADGYPELELELCNSFTTDELIAALPPTAYGVELQIHIKPEYASAGYYMVGTIADAMTVAEALAMVLILMIENGDTTAEEVNQRLTQ